MPLRIHDKLSSFRDERYLFMAIIVIGIFLRLFNLTERPMHHDESVHGYLAYWIYKYFAYTYDPAFHGPFIYYITAFAFYLFNDSILVARLVPVTFGVVLIILPYFLKRWLGNSYLFLSLLLGISPTFLYFTRFLRNDIFILVFFFITFIAYMWFRETGEEKYIVIGLIAAAFGFITKENAIIYAFIFISFMFFNGLREHRAGYIRLCLNYWRGYLVGLAVFAIIFSVFYSSFFLNPEGLKTAVIGSVEHWLKMHEIKDHYKPPYYYFGIFFRYEFLIFLMGLVGVLQILQKKEKNVFPLFVGYWAIMSLLIYGYLSHKVPWLSIHMLLPFAVGGAYLLKELRLDRKDVRVAMAVAVAATLVVAIHVNYINYANDDEMLVYVQTKPEFVQLVGILKKKLEMGEGVWVIEPENDYWPLPWYLRNYEVSFSRYPPDQINTTVVTSYSYEEEILNRINYEPVKVYYELRPGYYMVLIQKR